LDDALRTHDSFVDSVDARGGFNPFVYVPVAAGLLLMVPLYYISRPDPYFGEPPVPLWKAMFWCGSIDNGPNLVNIIIGWLGLALIIGGAVWLLRRHQTLPHDADQLFQQYLQSGFVVDLVPTGIMVMRGRYLSPLFFFGLPTTSYDDIMAALELVRTRLKANHFFIFKLSRLTGGAGVGMRGQALSRADDSLPSDVFAASNIGFPHFDRPRIGVRDGDYVRLYTLKGGVSTM